MTVTFKRASYLIKKYNSGYKVKESEIDEVFEWMKDFKEQLEMEKKTTAPKK